MKSIVKKRLFEKNVESETSTPVVSSSSNTGDGTLFEIPKGYMLELIVFAETGGSDVTVDVGTTNGGNEVFPAVTVSANGTQVVQINDLYSLTAAQSIYISSAAWGTSSLNVYGLTRKVS